MKLKHIVIIGCVFSLTTLTFVSSVFAAGLFDALKGIKAESRNTTPPTPLIPFVVMVSGSTRVNPYASEEDRIEYPAGIYTVTYVATDSVCVKSKPLVRTVRASGTFFVVPTTRPSNENCVPPQLPPPPVAGLKFVQGDSVKTKTDGVSVRTAPELGNNVVYTLTAGITGKVSTTECSAQCPVMNSSGKWWFVNLDGGRQPGWILENSLEKVSTGGNYTPPPDFGTANTPPPTLGNGAMYYIDYDKGSDNADGRSQYSAWKHAPGDPSAAGNARVAVLHPGDTVVFKGGVTYEFSLGVADRIAAIASGIQGNPITYISGHLISPPWGSGRAIIDGTNADLVYPVFNGIISLQDFDWLVVRGLDVRNWTSVYYDLMGAIGWNGSTQNANITIYDNDIHDLKMGGIVLQGRGYLLSLGGPFPTGAKIIHNIITRTEAHGLTIRFGWKDVLIENNFFDLNGADIFHRNGPEIAADDIALAYDAGYGVNNCLDAAPKEFRYDCGSVQENIRIINNLFTDSSAKEGLTPKKSHILVQENQKNLIISGNTFKDLKPVADIDIPGPVDGLFITNNVFNTNIFQYASPISFYTDQHLSNAIPYNNINIIGNTFISNIAGSAFNVIDFHTSTAITLPTFRHVSILNNIIDNDSSGKNLVYIPTGVMDMSTFNINNNAYNGGALSQPFYIDGNQFDFNGWKSYLQSKGVIGADSSSSVGAVSFVNRASKDFHLSAQDTLAKDRGVDASSYYTIDRDRVSRPQGGAWDVGAYEYKQ